MNDYCSFLKANYLGLYINLGTGVGPIATYFFFSSSKALESREINDDIDRDEFDVSIVFPHVHLKNTNNLY